MIHSNFQCITAVIHPLCKVELAYYNCPTIHVTVDTTLHDYICCQSNLLKIHFLTQAAMTALPNSFLALHCIS